MDAQARGQNDEEVSANEERLTEKIIADWRQKKKERIGRKPTDQRGERRGEDADKR